MNGNLFHGKKWQKTKDKKSSTTSVIFASTLKEDWLKQKVSLVEVKAKGPLKEFFSKANETLKGLKLYNFPTGSLSFLVSHNGLAVFSLISDYKTDGPEVTVFNDGQNFGQTSEDFHQALRQWCLNCVAPWCKRHEIDYLSQELGKVLSANTEDLIQETVVEKEIKTANGRLDYPLAVFLLARELEGEKVFEGLPPVRIVYPCRDDTSSKTGKSNSVSLVSAPTKSGDESFSMELDLKLDTVPCSDKIYVNVRIRKRNWSKKTPDQWKSPSRTSSYVFTEDGSVYKTEWSKNKVDDAGEKVEKWEPSWSYRVLNFTAGGDRVPLDFKAVVDSSLSFSSFDPDENGGEQWWVGYPESSQFIKSLRPRCVYEMDEYSTFESVTGLLEQFLDKKVVKVTGKSPLTNRKAKDKKEHKVLSLEHLSASEEGEILLSDLAEDISDADEFDLKAVEASTQKSIENFRRGNQKIFEVTYGDTKPILWVVSNRETEVRIIKEVSNFLFGDSLVVRTAQVPPNVHGLKANLPLPKGTSGERFSSRVEAWEPVMSQIAEKSQGYVPHVLICEDLRFENAKGTFSYEDPVNYYAGIHACAKIGANVHYVLPVEKTKSKTRKVVTAVVGQFVHRCQAAILDMMFAHYGKQVGISSFVNGIFPENSTPEFVFGFQKLTLQENRKKGVYAREYLLLSRINTEKEVTEFKVAFPEGDNKEAPLSISEWMPMSQALIWMGTQSVSHPRRAMQSRAKNDYAQRETVRIFKEFLIEIESTTHSKSILLVDYGSLKSSLPGFSNEGISKGEIKVDGISLSSFKKICVVRYKDEDVLTVREKSQTEYTSVILTDDAKAIKGVGSETAFDEYFTTGKKIFHLEDTAHSKVNHFILTMNYKNTSQGRRGLSAFRPMPRMVMKKLDPEAEDSAKVAVLEYDMPKKEGNIPAPIDITVIQKPDEWASDLIPSLIAKLKTDYAHYNDWTKKPAPLFFDLKIRDYVIQYDIGDTNEISEDAESEVRVVEEDQEEELSPIEEALAERILGEGIVSVEADGKEAPATPLTEMNKKDSPDPDEDIWSKKIKECKNYVELSEYLIKDLLSDDNEFVATHISKFMTFASSDGGMKLLKAVTRIRNTIKTEALLPPFAQGVDLYEIKPKVLKRNFGRAWKNLTNNFQLFARKPKPNDPYLWIRETTEILGGLDILNCMSSFFDGMVMVPFRKAVDEYNSENLNDKKLQVYEIEEGTITDFVKWCCDNDKDEPLAWAIIQLAHRARTEVKIAFFRSITKIPGPKTHQALIWVIASVHLRVAVESEISEAQGTRSAFLSNGKEMHEILGDEYRLLGVTKGLPKNLLPKDAGIPKQIPTKDSSPESCATEKLSEEELMAINLTEIVRDIKPGDKSFDDSVSRVQALMSQLEASLLEAKNTLKVLSDQHSAELERVAALALQESELFTKCEELSGHQLELLDKINEAAAQCGETLYSPTSITLDTLEQGDEIENHFGLIYEAALEFDNKQAALIQNKAQEPAAGEPAYKVKAFKKREEACLDAVIESATGVVSAALSSGLYEASDDAPVPPDGMDDHLSDFGKSNSTTTIKTEISSKKALKGSTSPSKVAAEIVTPELVATEIAATEVPRVLASSNMVLEGFQSIEAQSALFDHAEKEIPEESVSRSDSVEGFEVVEPEEVDEVESFSEVDEVDSLEDSNSLEFAKNALQAHIPALSKMVSKHLYGFADVHVQALSEHLRPSLGEESIHHELLSGIVRSLEAAECFHDFKGRISPELQTAIHETNLSPDEYVQVEPIAIGAMAATLPGLMFEYQQHGNIDLMRVVQNRLQGIPSVIRVFEQIAEINNSGLVITKDALFRSHVGEEIAIKAELDKDVRLAKNWIESPQMNVSFRYKGAGTVNYQLFGSGSQIHELMQMIARRENIDKIINFYDGISKKLTPKSIDGTIEDARKLTREKDRITGQPKEKIAENLLHTADFVEAHIARVKSLGASGKANQRMDKMLLKLNEYLSVAKQDITKVHCSSELDKFYCQAGAQMLNAIANLFNTNEALQCLDPVTQKLLIMVPYDADLRPSIHALDEKTGPIISPESVLDATTEALESSDDFFDENYGDLDDFLKTAMDEHRNRKRFIPAFLINERIGKRYPEKSEQLLKEYRKEREELGLNLNREKQRVVRAMALSALPNEVGSQMRSLIADMQEANKSNSIEMRYGIGHPEGAVELYPDFPHAKSVLRSWVIGPIEKFLAQAREALLREIEALEGPDSPYDQNEVAKIRNMIDFSSAETNKTSLATFRSAYDAINIIKTRGFLPDQNTEEKNYAKEYDDFCDAWLSEFQGNKDPIEELLTALTSDSKKDSPLISQLTEEEKVEAASIITNWVSTFRHFSTIRSKPDSFFDFISSVGLGDEKEILFDSLSAGSKVSFQMSDKTFVIPSTRDDDVFVPPELGSRAQNISGVLIGGVNKNTANTIQKQLASGVSNPQVIMFRGRLKMSERAQASSSKPVILVDDNMVAYLALRPKERLRSLIRIGVMTFDTNPYADYGNRPVPHEMFFGRAETLDTLTKNNGFVLLYGGRRLGKSSLLSESERIINSDEFKTRKAIIINMELAGGESYPDASWAKLHRCLHSEGLVDHLPSKLSAEDYQIGIRDTLKKNLGSIKTVSLMLDECDGLMDAELKNSGNKESFVRKLIQLTEDFNREGVNLNIVFAGLHNVTRMSSEVNSPLGKAKEIGLGTFLDGNELSEGVALVRQPFRALGYEFEDENVPLQILSICNFYPAFVQIYCQALLSRAKLNRQSKAPPFLITYKDLDVVESSTELIGGLQSKFKRNLDLDERYRAIALVLAEDYYKKVRHSGVNRGMSDNEIRTACKSFAPRHFENITDDLFRVLLNEMIKLNVLEKRESMYGLRNPDVAFMIGNRSEVETQLLEINEKVPNYTRSNAHKRLFVKTPKNEYHMLPFSQGWGADIAEHLMSNAPYREVIVYCGGKNSGVLEFSEMLNNLTSHGRVGEYRIGDNLARMAMMTGQGTGGLNRFRNSDLKAMNVKNEPIFLFVRPSQWDNASLPRFISQAKDASMKRVQIVLLATMEKTVQLIDAIAEKDPEARTLKNHMNANFSCTGNLSVRAFPTWTEDALYFTLEEHVDVAGDSPALSRILKVTEGQHALISKCILGVKDEETLLKRVEALRAQEPKALEEVREYLGIPENLDDQRTLKLFSLGYQLAMDDVSVSGDALAEAINKIPGVTHEDVLLLKAMGLIFEDSKGSWRMPYPLLDLIDAVAQPDDSRDEIAA